MTVAPALRTATSGKPLLVIDIGGTNVKFGYSLDGRPHGFVRLFPTQILREADPVDALAEMVDAVVAEAGLSPWAVVATVPGFIDTDEDRVLFAGNILGLNGRALASDLSRLVRCPVLLERDAVLTLTGETLTGVAQGKDNVLGIFFGTGIGAAFIQHGRVFRGNGWALEIGLMPFRGDGRLLSGMRTDCLEAYASGRALQEIADRHGEAIGTVFSATARKPALADEMALFVRHQAFAVATAVALFSPQTIVLGGGVLDIDGYPRGRLGELVEAHAPIAETGRPMDLRWARHGWTSVLHGAPLVVAEHLARRPELFRSHRTSAAEQPA
ncbi:MAG TPA: ROK family protein [Lichenihabitans sp.]|nr:ROK family protein [Lichenihabitans sp.]